MYIGLPFIGKKSDDLARELRQVICNYFSYIDPIIYYRSSNSIGSWFKLCDKPNVMMRSNVIYRYKCDCAQSYIGSTTVQLFIRIVRSIVVFRIGKNAPFPALIFLRSEIIAKAMITCLNLITFQFWVIHQMITTSVF